MADEGVDEVDFVSPDLPGRHTQLGPLSSIAEDDEVVTEALIAPLTMAESQLRRPSRLLSSISRTDSTYYSCESDYNMNGLTGWDCLYTNEEFLFWPPRDVTEIDSASYKKVLERDALGHPERLRHELHHVCRMNFVARLDILCGLLSEHGISLIGEDMLGTLSESPLHVAIIYNSVEATKILIRYGGQKLIFKHYGQGEYIGTSCLHAAIAKNNLEIIDNLMVNLDSKDRKALLHMEATGTYFRRKYSSSLPLSLAAFMGNREIVDALINFGAQLDATDSKAGNSVMHSLIFHSLHCKERALGMYHHILNSALAQKWWLKRRGLFGMSLVCSEYRSMKSHLLAMKNNDGLTPLGLAASTGAMDMCTAILKTDDVYRFPQWRCGPIEFHYYDISEVDAVLAKPGQTSVMDYFLFSNSDDRLSFCSIGPIRELLKKKWAKYQVPFFLWFLFHFLLMVAFTVCTSQRSVAVGAWTALLSVQTNSNHSLSGQSAQQLEGSAVGLMLTEIALLAAAICYLCGEIFDIISFFRQFFAKVFTLRWKGASISKCWSHAFSTAILRPDVFRASLLVFSLTILSVPFLRLNNSPEKESLAVAVAGISGWLFLLFFTRALKNMGMFTVMLEKMFLGDFVHFTVVFVVVISGFSLAFLSLFHSITPRGSGAVIPDNVFTFGTTMFTMFRLMCGLDEFDVLDEAHSPIAARVIFLFFVLVANILLLNMLIATMNDTYVTVSGQKENLWMKIRGKSVDMLERHLPYFIRPQIDLQHRLVMNHCGRKQHIWLLPVEEMAPIPTPTVTMNSQ